MIINSSDSSSPFLERSMPVIFSTKDSLCLPNFTPTSTPLATWLSTTGTSLTLLSHRPPELRHMLIWQVNSRFWIKGLFRACFSRIGRTERAWLHVGIRLHFLMFQSKLNNSIVSYLNVPKSCCAFWELPVLYYKDRMLRRFKYPAMNLSYQRTENFQALRHSKCRNSRATKALCCDLLYYRC